MKNLFISLTILVVGFLSFLTWTIVDTEREHEEFLKSMKIESIEDNTIRMERRIHWHEMEKLENGDYVYYGNDGVIHQFDSEYVDAMKNDGKTGVDIVDNFEF